MDNINYTYNKTAGELVNNKLASVSDNYNGNAGDIFGTHNYTYDAIGNLIADDGEQISSIDWTVYGKIKAVNRNGGLQKNLAFGYGADGNRMYKVVKGTGTTPGNAHTWTAQWYVRDASGNVMAIYNETFTNTATNAYASTLTLSELPIYGSSRIGIIEASGQEIMEFGATSTTNGFTPLSGNNTIALNDLDSYTLETDATSFSITNPSGSNTVTLTASHEPIYFGPYSSGLELGEGIVTDASGTYLPQGQVSQLTFSSGHNLTLIAHTMGIQASRLLNLQGNKPIRLIVDVPTVQVNSTRQLTYKKYELSNHLGNVLVTVSDLKLGIDANSDDIADAYAADVLSYTDYYPFGMPLPGRQLTPASGSYRYGFNSKELDDDGTGMGGGGNTYDYGFRIYNPQIAKFLSVDPLTKEYPWYTPYQFAGNSPIWAIDLDGLEEKITNEKNNVTTITVVCKYVVVTDGPNSVSSAVDIQKLTQEILLILNSIPPEEVVVKTEQILVVPDPYNRLDKTNPPEPKIETREITQKVQIQFKIEIVQQSGVKLQDVQKRSSMASLYSNGDGTGNLLGGIVRMGDPSEFAGLPPTTPAYWMKSPGGKIIGLHEIVLNPKYFDPSSVDFMSIKEQKQALLHEYGHGMKLDHHVGVYPSDGMMKAVDSNAPMSDYKPTPQEQRTMEAELPEK
jgi:RHS repeat-associated protein